MEELLKYAKFIGTKNNANTFVLEKEIEIKGAQKYAHITATALGLYFIKINGKRVGDAHLTPGWTSYNKMLQVQEYDVANLIDPGINKIEMVINVGWYAGRLAWENNYNVYGSKHAGCLELQIDNEIIYYTDDDWKVYTYEIQESSIYDGEVIDLGYKKTKLIPEVVQYNKENLVRQICEYVKDIQTIDVQEVIITPTGDTIYDFGQNLTGVVRVEVPKDMKQNIELKYAEILINGEFYTENLRSAKCTDLIKNAEGKTVTPEFTFHGFRYLHSSVNLPKQCFKAIVRHTDMKRTGVIHSRNVAFNRLMANITWGQRGNFVDIPTDCPQRDERLGWTGDINAFCKTAAYNFDVRLILKKYLADLRNDQLSSGEIPHVAPDCLHNGSEPSAMWTDAICFIPWNLYEMYGDVSFLRDNIDAMKKYIGALETRMEKGLIVKGQIYGDWLALDNEMNFKDSPIGRTDKLYLANCFYCEDCKIVYQICEILEDKDGAKLYQKKYQNSLIKTREEYFNLSGRLLLDTVTAQVIALHFNIVPENRRKQLAFELAENVKRHGYHVTTGFIGTAYLLYALADNGYMDVASKLIMNHEYPGWLYEVDMGATTTWERWSSLMPNGQPDSKGMNSYNHYAYGAMKEFIYSHVAGFEPIEPGFKSIRIKPLVLEGLDSLDAKFLAPTGLLKTSYRLVGDKGLYEFTFPKEVNVEIFINGKNYVFNGKNNLGHFKEEVDLSKKGKSFENN